MDRKYGRAPRGQKVVGRKPRNYGTIVTVIGALSVDGLDAVMTIEGGTSGDVFVMYTEHWLLPVLESGDVVVMDNLGAHKDIRVRELIEGVGAHLVFLPPYSPDLNPIELTWAKVKGFLRIAKARTLDALNNAVAFAMDLVTRSDARGWIRHCGYVVDQAA
jgi:transposase